MDKFDQVAYLAGYIRNRIRHVTRDNSGAALNARYSARYYFSKLLAQFLRE